jgi:LPXTG-motif cell wall-anchored protein
MKNSLPLKLALAALAAVLLAVPLQAASARGHHHHRHHRPVAATRGASARSRGASARSRGASARARRPVAVLTPASARQRHRARRVRHRRTASTDRRIARRLAHAAGDPSDTISDFQFAPATLTIHVGDTITWINNGPAPHTATAKDGSFDTGILKKGQSGSHTFSSAGTFAYFCTVHPFMHGTVVVLANAASTTPGNQTTTPAGSATSPAAGTATTPAASTAQATGPSLPNTGFDAAAAAAIGVALLALGALLRRERATQR